MKYKIACPTCSHPLSLSDPKVGKYKPTCSKCNTPFAIVVEAGDPLKIRVGKLSTNPTEASTPSAQPQKSSHTKPANVANLEATLPPDSMPTRSNSRPKASPTEAPKPTGFDVTLPGDSAPAAYDPESTMAFNESSAGNKATRPSVPNLEQTIEHSTTQSGPSVASGKSTKATNPSVQPQTSRNTKPAESVNLEATLPAESMPTARGNSRSDASYVDAPKATGFDVTLPGDSATMVYDSESTMAFSESSEKNSNSTAIQSAEQTMDHSTSHGRPTESADISVDSGAIARTRGSVQDGQKSSQSKSEQQVERLGGYKIIQELGAGGMGKVYLATQISLDRNCAVKTIHADWAKNPKAIARFIREAYAAAQLTHHNVVQIYDLGQDGGTNFFSMELVSGGSLDDQLKKKGKLTPKLAATLILQAARGLKFAHDHGMVHRDIKPANLMLTSDGLVKIADMGLIKTPNYEESNDKQDADQQALMLASARAQVTLAGASMGTPAYMSPEQAEDAAAVDKRADIYSLGCTFYALLTGKPPFEGATLLEVITKHRQEKLTRPEVVVNGLPPKLGDIIEKMTEKNPDDRYQDLEEAINDIEVFLELREDMSDAKIKYFDARDQADAQAAPETATQEQTVVSEPKSRPAASPTVIPTEAITKIQRLSTGLSASPLRLVERFVPPAWIALCASVCIIALLMALGSGFHLITEGAKSLSSFANSAGDAEADTDSSQDSSQAAASSGSTAMSHLSSMASRLRFALMAVLTMVLAPIFSIGLAGREGTSVIAQRYRQSFLSGGWWNYAYAIFAILALILLIHIFGLWLTTILSVVLGAIAGAGYYFGVQRPIDANCKNVVDQAQAVIKQLRLQGADEQAIQTSIAKHSGRRWEELYEGLFGYDAMRTMRSRLSPNRKTSKLWSISKLRDRLIDRLEDQVTEQKRVDEQRILAQAEKAELIAAGVSAAEAKKRADAVAASMVDVATETRKTMQELATGKLTDEAAEAKRQRIKQMLAEARSGKVTKPSNTSRAMQFVLNQVLGAKCRLAIAAVLLLVTGLWINHNMRSLEAYWQQTKETVNKIAQDGVENMAQNVTESTKQAIAATSEYRWRPVMAGLVTNRNIVYVGLAGLFMLWGACFAGWKPSLFFIPVAFVILAIPIFI